MVASGVRPILVTGAAGFIGAAVALRLLGRGERVIGVDNLNSYYDPALKRARLARIAERPAQDHGLCSTSTRPRVP
jgi:UDP-glucuronate 4-epimerase